MHSTLIGRVAIRASWAEVSLKLTYTRDYAEYLSGFANLPNYKRFFENYGTARLSKEGIAKFHELKQRELQQPPNEVKPVIEAVEYYAGRLKPVYVNVKGLSYLPSEDKGLAIYEMAVDAGENLFSTGTIIWFKPNNESWIRGRIVAQGLNGDVLYIALEKRIFEESSLPARLEIEEGYTLAFLLRRLRKLRAMPNLIKSILVSNTEDNHVIKDINGNKVVESLLKKEKSWGSFCGGRRGQERLSLWVSLSHKYSSKILNLECFC